MVHPHFQGRGLGSLPRVKGFGVQSLGFKGVAFGLVTDSEGREMLG